MQNDPKDDKRPRHRPVKGWTLDYDSEQRINEYFSQALNGQNEAECNVGRSLLTQMSRAFNPAVGNFARHKLTLLEWLERHPEEKLDELAELLVEPLNPKWPEEFSYHAGRFVQSQIDTEKTRSQTNAEDTCEGAPMWKDLPAI